MTETTTTTGEGHGRRRPADPTDERSNCGVGVVMDLDGDADHWVVQDGLELLANLEHRVPPVPRENTGDGAGIMLQMPHDFFAAEIDEGRANQASTPSAPLFLPQDEDAAAELVDEVESTFADEGLDVVAWRSVPTNNEGYRGDRAGVRNRQ